MTKGSYSDFRDALRAFESGWDRERYEAGVIADWQLDQWAGGTVADYFSGYATWGDLTDDEWNAMSYRSMNSLGFVGYQFGEALLIDLDYYNDTVFYGNGAASNTWDGQWIGKHGVNSLEDFMTATAQERAIQEAFGYNLLVIETGLGYQGESLDDYLGTSRTYTDGGQQVTVTLTLSGIMAAAHLRGAWGTLNLLQSGNVSTDEYGTSILRYIQQFGDYSTPSIEDAISVYLGADPIEVDAPGEPAIPNLPPEEPEDDDPAHTSDPERPEEEGPQILTGSRAFDNPEITASTASVTIDWQWGRNESVAFDPATDTLFVAWIGSASLELAETQDGVTLLVPSNNQSVTLAGVTLSELDPARINLLDQTTRELFAQVIGSDPDDDDGDHDNDHDDDTDHPNDGRMYDITLTSQSQTISDFNPASDMLHIGPGITAEQIEIFEESGNALGQTVRIAVIDPAGVVLSTTILTGLGLSDLSIANFSIAEQTAQNEVAAALGTEINVPSNGGYALSYDDDGSNPPAVIGTSPLGGMIWRADSNADDIVGFDPATDILSVGGTSVHGMILTKSPAGEIVVDSPWSDTAQIVTGVSFTDVGIRAFGVVGNEHFRQDIGGVMSWENDVGPRTTDTVYVRSHEYGVSEIVNNFDPSTMKISFLYFGTRERLSVEDTPAGLVISSLPSGQSLTLTDVEMADLVPGLVEFHHDQVMEDNLEVPFGFNQDEVTLVSREGLLTPEAPDGATTDGFQTQTGLLNGTTGPEDPGDDSDLTTPDPNPDEPVSVLGTGVDAVEVFWDWGAQTTIEGFDPSEDTIDFRSLGAQNVSITEVGDALVVEVVGNGGNSTTLLGIRAEDLSVDNLTADDWNDIADAEGQLVSSLQALGMDAS